MPAFCCGVVSGRHPLLGRILALLSDTQCICHSVMTFSLSIAVSDSLTFFVQHIMIDLGTGNNNKINWAMTDKQEFIDIVETVYRGARKGRGLVVSPKGRNGMGAVKGTGM